MKFQYLLVAVITSVCLSACAVPPLNFSLSNVAMSQQKIDAELKSITVSIAKPDEITGTIDFENAYASSVEGARLGEIAVPQQWQAALIEALNNMMIFLDDSPNKMTLTVKILKLDTSRAGFSFITESSARYEIIDRKTGKIVFSKDITASGLPPSAETLNGWVLRQESVNLSVRKNITLFLQTLETSKLSIRDFIK